MAALNIGRGRESAWVHGQNKSATERLLTKMVNQGKLPQSALDALYGAAEDSVPTTLINARPSAEVVPQYVKSRFPGAHATSSQFIGCQQCAVPGRRPAVLHMCAIALPASTSICRTLRSRHGSAEN